MVRLLMRHSPWTYGIAGARLAEAWAVFDHAACASPRLRLDPTTGTVYLMRCNDKRTHRCQPCASRYRRSIARLATEGVLRAVARPGRHLAMLTVTGPGTQAGHARLHPRLDSRWVTSAHARPVCGCEHEATDVGRWNAAAGDRWNHLRTLIRRELDPTAEYFCATEVQARGWLHKHVLIDSAAPIDPAAVQLLALRAGFGCAVDVQTPTDDALRFARYVVKYVTKSTDGRGDVPWDGPRPTFRTWSQSGDTRCDACRPVCRHCDGGGCCWCGEGCCCQPSARTGFSYTLAYLRAQLREATVRRLLAAGVEVVPRVLPTAADLLGPLPPDPDPPPF